MPKAEIEEFAGSLVRYVRDAAIKSCDQFASHDATSPVAKRWQQATPAKDAIRLVIPDCIDETIFHLLRAIDEGLLRICIPTQDDHVLDLTKEGMGELAGWYMGSGGWRAQFAKERYVDDFADLGQSET